MATNIKRHTQYYSGNGAPKAGDSFYSLNVYAHYFDRDSKKFYIYMGSGSWILDPEYQISGSGTSVTVGTTTTLPAGSQATVTDSDPSGNVTLNFGIPKGADGQNGTEGGTIQGFVWHTSQICETPTNILVIGTNTTNKVGSASYPGIGATSTDMLDWANLTYALALGNQKKKGIFSSGIFNVNKMVDMGKYAYRINWDGFLNTEIQSHFNTGSVVSRPAPTDNTDANLMIQATYGIKNITIKANPGQTCFEPGPSYSSKYEMIRTEGGTTGFLFRFSLNARVTLCDAAFCDYGFIADYGNWYGATASNSQSNHLQYIQCHATGGTSTALGKVGFGGYGSSGIRYTDCIVEWFGYERGIDTDYKNSTVVKSGGVFNCHIEGISGNRGCASGDAFFRIRMPGTFAINNSYQQYAGCMINAGTNAGQLQLIVEQIPWIVKPSDGKLFVNAGNCFFDFRDNAAGELCNPNNFTSLFFVGAFNGGIAVSTTMNQGFASGINRWCMRGTGFTSGVYNYTPSVSRIAETEVNKPYKLMLTAKQEAIDELMKSPRLVSLAKQMEGVHEWYFDTEDEAIEFANDNKDFNYTITTLR